MLSWEEIDPSAKLTPAFFCTINRGIMDDAGNRIDLPARIYADDALMLALDADHMKMVLAATIEAIFIVMGVLAWMLWSGNVLLPWISD